jgi:hypothetical protein
MGNKVGRPAVPKQSAKSVLLGAQLSPSEAKEAARAASSSGLDKSKWLRGAIDNEVKGPPIWVKSKWKREDLDENLIEFELRSKVRVGDQLGLRVLSGVGRLRVRENIRGEIAVDIFVDEATGPSSGVVTRIWLSQEAVDRIELNPNPKPAKFRLRG